MTSYYRFLSLLPLVQLANAGVPLEKRQDLNTILTPCASCFRSSWTQGPECTTNTIILSTISRIENPPAEATSTYTPSQWCSDYLRQTDWTTFKETISTVSTYTSRVFTQPLVTKTDLSHPTSTALCPIPSSGQECGWDSNTIDPAGQKQDWSISDDGISSAEECHQACLERDGCKSYRWDGKNGNPCEIFGVAIGSNGGNLINASPSGTQWWDRDCQVHLPTGCSVKSSATAPPTKSKRIARAAKPAPANAVVTPAPVPAPEVVARDQLVKRGAPFPPYMSDLSYFWSSIYVTPACSCIISSAAAPVPSNTTTTYTKYTSTVSITTTTIDPFTVTVTPRETTVYVSVN